MSVEKAEALVVRLVDFSESSSVVTLFTREFGKVSALAKGARRLKGPFESSLDLLSRVRIVFLRKSGDALDLLTEGKLEKRFRVPGRELSRLYAGYYVAELLNDLTHEHDPHVELFDAAIEALDRFADESRPTGDVILRWELSALRILGHLPSLDACVECGRSVSGGRRTAFGLASGGVFCDLCRPGKKHVATLSIEALHLLRVFAEPDDAWRELAVDRRPAGELRGILNQYMNHLLGRSPRMQTYLSLPGRRS